ncbi:type IV pilus assembly protein PilA [Hydrogenophaga palleronii]|uniref:Type IV pilus assembly protein PilA n=1 Tax=Hydrogenophaga palleronii TaxID=65655 RepID=A0ABU1WM70_9BURK|nr:pilin [Hydrogenophaga palleronii]MDR7150395.1 type IV pilus assembly protein PilA [Hydrogenophaga palleronii]
MQQNAAIFSRHLIAHTHVKTSKPHHQGFSLIELMVVVAIIAILALLAAPSLAGKYIRENIVEAMPLANIAKGPVAAAWATTQTLPEDNESAGLPAADKMVNNVVKSITVEEGAIHILFGNRANGALQGKTLTLRPAVVEDSPIVPVAWVCGHAKAPEKMTVMGVDRTDIAKAHLPVNCF